MKHPALVTLLLCLAVPGCGPATPEVAEPDVDRLDGALGDPELAHVGEDAQRGTRAARANFAGARRTRACR